MELMSVALFRDRTLTERMKDRLVQAGLDARVGEETGLQKLWFVPRRKAGLVVEVPADQFERAEALLQRWDTTEAPLREAVRCPECKSFRVQYPQYARNSMLTNLLLGIASALGIVEKSYYCESCHLTWPRRGETRRASDTPAV